MGKTLKVLSAGSLVLMALCIAGAAGALTMPGTYTALQIIVCWVLFVFFGAVSLISGFAADQVQKEKPPLVQEHLGRQTKNKFI